ncbi:MAG TPA: proline--tRNA ligase [Burkholderiales bacterium]|nr:proline--tRNA ligase [Burkholderiales bacterium]
MRTSRHFISTVKEAPSDAELVSHKLMIRAGMVRRLAAGIYTWMPVGLRVVRKIEAIVREEMDRAGACELSMPVVQPAELWQESGRWGAYGPELLRFKDRHERDFVIQPTSEEVITDIARAELRSYRRLPVHFYQIQTKFRDERRPRFGVMRGREFVMKDGYSFHADYADLEREYRSMYDTYTRIFTRLGLKFRAVAADTGAIGGTGSHEFQVLADSGEDAIAWCPESDYAANVELAEAIAPKEARQAPTEQKTKVATPGKTKCQDVAALLNVPLAKTVKAIAVIREDVPKEAIIGRFVMILLRGDHELNEVKTQKILGNFRFAKDDEIENALKCRPGYIGPITNELLTLYLDRTVATMSDFVCGANEAGFHLRGVNWGRDHNELPSQYIQDFRKVVEGDPSPDGKGTLKILRGIEVGHIFQLRTKYSEALKATYLDDKQQPRPMEMGCYGIGITRIAAAAIEQGHDDRGIVFPRPIAPFEACLVPIGFHKSAAVREAAEKLYAELTAAGVDVLLEDRDERPGVLFADMDLLGIPHRLVISDRGLAAGTIEYKGRTQAAAENAPFASTLQFLKEKFAS